MFTKAVRVYLEDNSWPSFLSWWIISSLLGFRARIKNVGGGSCIGFESSILSYLDRVVISSRQSRTKSREASEPYTQKQPKRIERRIQLHTCTYSTWRSLLKQQPLFFNTAPLDASLIINGKEAIFPNNNFAVLYNSLNSIICNPGL